MKVDRDIISALMKLTEEGDLTQEVKDALANFVCLMYCPKGIHLTSIPDLRWHLFCKEPICFLPSHDDWQLFIVWWKITPFPHDGSAYKRESLISNIRRKNIQWFTEAFKWTSLNSCRKQSLLYSFDIQKIGGWDIWQFNYGMSW